MVRAGNHFRSHAGTYEAEVEDQEIICDLRGETAPLETFLSEVSKQELQIKVSKR